MARYRVTVNSVTAWEEGNEAAADYSHGLAASEIMRMTAEEQADKVESERWNDRMKQQNKLPFVYEDEAEDEEDAKSLALQELSEQLCPYEYLEPTDCDCEIEILEEEE